MRSAFVLLCLAACPAPPPKVFQPIQVDRPGEDTATPTQTDTGSGGSTGGGPAAPAKPRRHDWGIARQAMDLALVNDTLVWADIAGAVWMMPADGAKEPKQISEQHRDGFVTHPFTAGSEVIALSKGALLSIAAPAGTIEKAKVTGANGTFQSPTSDDTSVYITLSSSDAIMRVPKKGGAAKKVTDLPQAVLDVHGDTLFAASNTTGEVISVPVAGGAKTTLGKVATPTAIAADDQAVYVYSEADRSIVRIERSTKTASVIATQLENSDEIVLVGEYIYTVSWPHDLVRLGKTAGKPVTKIAEDLFQPRGVAVDDHAVYVTSEGPPRIVRIPLER